MPLSPYFSQPKKPEDMFAQPAAFNPGEIPESMPEEDIVDNTAPVAPPVSQPINQPVSQSTQQKSLMDYMRKRYPERLQESKMLQDMAAQNQANTGGARTTQALNTMLEGISKASAGIGAVSGADSAPKSTYSAEVFNKDLDRIINDRENLANQGNYLEQQAMGEMGQVEDYDEQVAQSREQNDPNSNSSKRAQQALYQYLSPQMREKFDVSKLSAAEIGKQMPLLLKQQENEQKYGFEQRKMEEADKRFNQQLAANQEEKAANRQFQQAMLSQKLSEQRDNRIARANEQSEKKRQGDIQERALSEGKVQRLDNINAGYDALENLEKAMDEGDWKVSLIGDNNYTKNARIFTEMLGRMQSGGAIGKDEEERFVKMLPRVGDSDAISRSKIADLKNILKQRGDTLAIGAPGIEKNLTWNKKATSSSPVAPGATGAQTAAAPRKVVSFSNTAKK